MTEVKFYDAVEDTCLRFAVIAARTQGKWVFCRHKARETYEAPGGRREAGETILETARRELYEETGAVQFDIYPMCVYGVRDLGGGESFGMLYYAEIHSFEPTLRYEIEQIVLADAPPGEWTYPEIQPRLMEEVKRRIATGQS